MPFQFRLQLANGEPADPPTFATAVPTWRPGDPVFIRPGHSYRVVDVCPAEDEAPGVLVVEPE
jgi:hypothetical protein